MARKHTPASKQVLPKIPLRPSLSGWLSQRESIFPWIVAGLYMCVMGLLIVRYHRVGGLGVETDFYAELVPQAKKLLGGDFSPLNYGAKGPVYSVLLAAVYLPVRDYFAAGILLNLLSGAVFLVAFYRLVKRLFSPVAAALSLGLVVVNHAFISFTYQASSDLPFMALCMMSMVMLFSGPARWNVILSALFGSAAFLTRYNGAFIVAGSLVYLFFTDGSTTDRLKRAGLWLAVFTLAGLPWFIPNWIATGSPVRNDNYMNVMLEYYGSVSDQASYETWTDSLPKEFTGMGDIILYDPVYFAKHTAVNAYSHFRADLTTLLPKWFAVFVLAGVAALWFARPDRKKLFYFVFSAVYFLILTIVFYNVRFSLFLLTAYVPLAVWPLTAQPVAGKLKSAKYLPAIILAAALVVTGTSTSRRIVPEMIQSLRVAGPLRDLGLALKKTSPPDDAILIARKPHTAAYAGVKAMMFPADVTSIGELTDFCKAHGVGYVLYSGLEYQYRPHLRELLNLGGNHPGLAYLFHNDFGVIYRVAAK